MTGDEVEELTVGLCGFSTISASMATSTKPGDADKGIITLEESMTV